MLFNINGSFGLRFYGASQKVDHAIYAHLYWSCFLFSLKDCSEQQFNLILYVPIYYYGLTTGKLHFH